MLDRSRADSREGYLPSTETLGAHERAQDFTAKPLRVLFPLEPFVDESLLGYLSRVAGWNVLGSVSPLLSPLGIKDLSDLSQALSPVSDLLAASLGIPQSRVERMLALPNESRVGWVDYFGAPLRRCHFVQKYRRFSPASLRRSDHHRANWMIGSLPFCPESWELLVHKCHCGAELGWRKAHGIAACEVCRKDLRDLTPSKIPESQRDELAVLADLVSPLAHRRTKARDLVPARFQHLEPTAIFELAIGFGRASDTTVTKTKKPFPTALVLSGGARLLLGYPKSFEAHANRRLDNETRSPLFVGLHAAGRFDFSPELKGFVADLVAEFEPLRHGPSRLKAIRESAGRMSLVEVAIKLGVDNAKVRLLSREGAFESGRARGARRQIEWFEPGSVGPVAEALASRLSLTEFSRRFHLPFDGVEQLFSLGLLTANKSPYVRILHPDLQLDKRCALSLADEVRSKLVAPHDGAITLSEAFFAIGASEKPWGAMIAAILRDDVPGGVALPAGSPLKFDALTISPEFSRLLLTDRFADLRRLPRRSRLLGAVRDLGRTEVERYLNCFPRDVSQLILAGHLEVLGSGPARFSRWQVVQLGRFIISSREIMWRWRVSPSMRDALPDLGIDRVVGPFWPRAAVTKHFEKMFPRGIPI